MEYDVDTLLLAARYRDDGRAGVTDEEYDMLRSKGAVMADGNLYPGVMYLSDPATSFYRVDHLNPPVDLGKMPVPARVVPRGPNSPVIVQQGTHPAVIFAALIVIILGGLLLLGLIRAAHDQNDYNQHAGLCTGIMHYSLTDHTCVGPGQP